jgi:hypothetical protein
LLQAVGASELALADRTVFNCPLLRCGNEGIRFSLDYRKSPSDLFG